MAGAGRVPERDHFQQLGPLDIGEVMGFTRVLEQVVQLPAAGLEIAQLFIGQQQLAAAVPDLVGPTGIGSHGTPTVEIDGAMGEHLKARHLAHGVRLRLAVLLQAAREHIAERIF